MHTLLLTFKNIPNSLCEYMVNRCYGTFYPLSVISEDCSKVTGCLRLFGLTVRDLFLIEYWYYGTKCHLVFTFFFLLELHFMGFLSFCKPLLYLLLYFLWKKLETFMNSLIKVPPSECRLKVPTPESIKTNEYLYRKTADECTLNLQCKSSHGVYLILGLTFY